METPIFQFKPPFWEYFIGFPSNFCDFRQATNAPLSDTPTCEAPGPNSPGGRSHRWPFENVARPVMHCDAWCDLVFFRFITLLNKNGAHLYYHQAYCTQAGKGGIELIEPTKMPQCVLKHRSRTIGPGQNETDHLVHCFSSWDATLTSRGDAAGNHGVRCETWASHGI